MLNVFQAAGMRWLTIMSHSSASTADLAEMTPLQLANYDTAHTTDWQILTVSNGIWTTRWASAAD